LLNLIEKKPRNRPESENLLDWRYRRLYIDSSSRNWISVNCILKTIRPKKKHFFLGKIYRKVGLMVSTLTSLHLVSVMVAT